MHERVRTVVWSTVLAFVPATAAAHHTAGQGASEGLRAMVAGGGSVQARQRVAWLNELVRSTDEPNLNPSTVFTSSILVSALVQPWTSVGVQAPLIVVDEDAEGVPTKIGYGDTRLLLRFSEAIASSERESESEETTPGATGSITGGFDVSLPTRTVRYEVDPGRQFSVTPLISFEQRVGRWSGQALVLAPIENRPAGTAVDVGLGGAAGFWATTWWNLRIGAMGGMRVATRCATAGGGGEWCAEGRVTERNRETGSVRVDGMLGSTLALTRDLSLDASVQLPLTVRRDFLVAASLGLHWSF